jgi:hypothetical protein
MVLTDRARGVELVPPDGLAHNPSRGIFRVLVCRWGEAIERPHKHAGTVFDRGDVRLPDRDLLERLPVNVDHGSDQIGVILSATTDEAGLWASVKFGDQGRYLLAIGFRGVSLETDDEGRLCGLALAVKAPAGLPSAQVLVDGPVTVPRYALAPVVASTVQLSREPDPFRQKSGTLIGSAKAPVNPAEWSAPSFNPRPVPLSLTEAELEAQVVRDREREEDRQRSLVEAASWDWEAEKRRLWEQGAQMQREHDEAKRRRVERELQRPWQSFDLWLDANLGRLEEAL